MNKVESIKRILCLIAALCCCFAVKGSVSDEGALSYAAEDENQYDVRLSELDREQEELDRRIASAGADADSKREKLSALSEKIESLRKELDETEAYSLKLEDEVMDLDTKLRETDRQLREKENEIKKEVNGFLGRMRALYVAGSSTYADVLLSSENFYDVLMRSELIERVAKHDNDTLKSLLGMLEQIKHDKAVLEEESKALKERSAQCGEQWERYISSFAELESASAEYEAELSQLENTQYELSQRVSEIVSERAEVRSKAEQSSLDALTETLPPETSSYSSETTELPPETSPIQPSVTAAPVTEELPPETPTSAVTEAPEPPSEVNETQTEKTSKVTVTAPPETSKQTAAPQPTSPSSAVEQKIKIVCDYARANQGGAYVWAGESFRACDCSGLVKICYKKVGIDLPHYAAYQAEYGRTVALSDIRAGDLVFFGNYDYASIYHVGIYVGNGKMVHAQSTDTGIVISDFYNYIRWSHVTCIKRLLT